MIIKSAKLCDLKGYNIMIEFNGNKIRNVAIVGNFGEGKTTLAEAMLFNSKVIDRMGKTTDGNTVMDYDAEEIARGMSISLATASLVWKDVKMNLVDVPGFLDFAGETVEALTACGGAVLVADANGELTVGAENTIDYCLKNNKPLMIFVNGMDKDKANYAATVAVFREKYGKKVAPIQAPIMVDGKMQGFVSLISGKAFEFIDGGRRQVEVPENMAGDLEEMRLEVMESAAENDDDLMEKYFDEGSLSGDDIILGIKKGVLRGNLVPVVAGCALYNRGVINLLNEIYDLMPSPKERENVKATNKAGEVIKVKCDEDAAFSGQVFKTVVDPFVGKLSMIRIYTGILNSGDTVVNARNGEKERINQLYMLKGKKQDAVERLVAGDIGAVSKLNSVKTGDTLRSDACDLVYPPIPFDTPALKMAIAAEKKGDEDKVYQGFYKLADEDLSFQIVKDEMTGETVVLGQGETQLKVLCKKLKTKFGASAMLVEPKIAYRETIKGSASAEGRHKRQSGGAGQFGVASVKFEPGAADGQFEFVDAVVGGAVPRQFIPAVEKGLREAINKGVLAGFPVIDLKCTLFDGKYHPVDSNEVSFIMAAKLAYEEAMPNAKPVILEPIEEVIVTVPDSYTGDIIGDFNKRRGRIIGMEMVEGKQVITAEAPQAELAKYAIDLRGMTQGRGKYTAQFARYEEVPFEVAQEIIKKAKA